MDGRRCRQSNFGDPLNIALGVATFVIVIITYRFGKGFIGNLAILVGLILGTAPLCFVGVDFSEVGRSQWVSIVTPLYFGLQPLTLLLSFL